MSCWPTLEKRWRRSTGVSGILTGATSVHSEAAFLEDRFGRELSFAEAEAEARRFAGFLVSRGMRRGERVAIHVQNRVEVATALFGTSLAGGIFTVLNPKLRPKGLSAILSQAEPSVIVVDSVTRTNLEGLELDGITIVSIEEKSGPDAISWNEALTSVDGCGFSGDWEGCDLDPACLVFTSGSTGTPRGVTLSHDNLSFVVGAIQERLGYRPDDIVGGFLPLAFDYGLYQIFLAAQAGAKLYIGDPDQVGPRLPRLLREAAVTVLPGVPSVYAALIALGRRGPLDLPTLRAITNTGERLPLAYIEELKRLFPGLLVYAMYGLTECKRVSILLPSEFEAHPDTVGRALSGTEAYAVDAEGCRLPPGAFGELVVRGRHVALGYWRAQAETERRFRKRAPESAVELFTGDSGSVDGEGFIRFSARSDDWMKHRGHRLSPLEIETEACQITGVVEASLIQRESDDTLHLFITTSDASLEAGAILRALGEVLEPAKVPDRVVLLPEMPKSLNGKIDRKTLVEHLAP
ncbi:MAG: acyl--CoA ligase [Verrucomicrobiae bacterium]|nr:acyl--CoA ligase [Verrucomicrobiae bacterium]